MSPLTPTGRSRHGLSAVLRPRVLVPVVIVAGAAVVTPLVLGSNSGATTATTSKVQGWPADGASVAPDRLAATTVHVSGTSADKVSATVDGRPVTVTPDGAGARFSPGRLPDGTHVLVVDVAGKHYTRSFTVDGTPPSLAVKAPGPLPMGKPVTVGGDVEPGAVVTVNGQPVKVAGSTWSESFPKAPGQLTVVATDPAGNRTERQVSVKFDVPLTRAVHMTALAWGYKPKRDAVLRLVKQHRINAVEVDIKDEDGVLGYKSQVPLAVQDHATKFAAYDAKAMLDQLHGLGVRVVGRLVAFHDPKLAGWAWKHGHHDWVIQDRSRKPWQGTYGSYAFANFANPEVQQYNVDIAVEAAKLGFDDILYDYVRRPDGDLKQMRIAGLHGTGEAQVADFVRQTRAALDAAGTDTFLGASVFGIAATRPKEIAQNIPMIAQYADYVSPMVYPSHWGPGEYGIGNPNSHPYAIVQRSLKDFNTKLKGTHAVVIPWLQDFSLGVHYTAAQVLAQERGAQRNGIEGFLLWNAGCDYDVAATPVMKH
ncbi:MAG: putative glycoside hydrolase [Frankiaceae bacterium]